jgi:hypothetical protein
MSVFNEQTVFFTECGICGVRLMVSGDEARNVVLLNAQTHVTAYCGDHRGFDP